jgi:CBS domain containing-hemolysin-like protein
MKIELVIIYLMFVWLLTAWEALLQLSRGRVRKIESEDRELARRAERWIENQAGYDIIFRILCFALIGAMSIMLIDTFRGHADFEKQEMLSLGSCAGIILICVVAAECVAKLMISRFYMPVLRFTMPLISILSLTVFIPIVFGLKKFCAELENSPGKEKNGCDRPTAEDEIMSLVEKSEEEGADSELEDDERRMIKGIFDLDDTLVREIMTPRVDVVSLSLDATVAEARKKIVESGHSRIPVYKDTIDEISGVIYAKDFLDDERCASNDLHDFIHKPIFVPETKNVGDLLEEFKMASIHFAVIIDEYGGTSGIVTMEDIIEEIVGEIRDEYDTDEEEESDPEPLSDGSYIIDARHLISDLNELLETDLPDEDVDTIGGYVCGRSGRIPEAGEEFSFEDDNVYIKILKADRRKILTLSIKLLEERNE